MDLAIVIAAGWFASTVIGVVVGARLEQRVHRIRIATRPTRVAFRPRPSEISVN